MVWGQLNQIVKYTWKGFSSSKLVKGVLRDPVDSMGKGFYIHAIPVIILRPKKVFDWRNPTDPRYPADPRFF